MNVMMKIVVSKEFATKRDEKQLRGNIYIGKNKHHLRILVSSDKNYVLF